MLYVSVEGPGCPHWLPPSDCLSPTFQAQISQLPREFAFALTSHLLRFCCLECLAHGTQSCLSPSGSGSQLSPPPEGLPFLKISRQQAVGVTSTPAPIPSIELVLGHTNCYSTLTTPTFLYTPTLHYFFPGPITPRGPTITTPLKLSISSS